MGQFNQEFVRDKGGVAWVKQVAASMDPGAVESQIRGYQQAASKLTEVQKTLQNVKANLAATWTGDAAEQAQQSFQRSINRAQATQETITGNVVPTLQGAKATEAAFIAEAAHLPDEKPVPSTNAVAAGFDWVTGQATDTQLAEAHNVQVRSQAAQALNALSDAYERSASQLRQAASVNKEGAWRASSGAAFDLGSVSSSSGNGAASRYSQRVGGGDSTALPNTVAPPARAVNVGFNSRTMLASASAGSSSSSSGTVTDTPMQGGSSSTISSAPIPILIEPDPVETGGSQYTRGGVVTDELGTGVGNSSLSTNQLGDENLQQARPSSSPGVFDEMGFSDGQSTSGSRTGVDSPPIEQGTRSGGEDLIEIEPNETGSAGGFGQRMGSFGVGARESRSSRYLPPSSYLDPVDEGSSVSLPPVRSAFEDATDALGNPLDMMTAGQRHSVQDRDEEDERGKRPPYLKEDAFWNSAQRIVPPVIQ